MVVVETGYMRAVSSHQEKYHRSDFGGEFRSSEFFEFGDRSTGEDKTIA